MYFIVLRSVCQAGITLSAKGVVDEKKDFINIHTTHKLLEKLVITRVNSQRYVSAMYYLFPYFISLLYVLEICKEEIKNGSFAILGKY